MSRLGNGEGSVYKLSGKRKNPWCARKTMGFKMNGQPIYRYIGYYRTKADALSALINYNKSPYSLEKETLKDIYEMFIVGYAETRHPDTVSRFNRHWSYLEPLHDSEITKISRRKLQLFFDNLKVTEIVKGKVKNVLKMLYDYAVRYDIILPEHVAILNYIDLSSEIEVKEIERDRFSDEEIQKIKEIDDNMAHILLFLMYTGLRAGEFCDLTEESIDEDFVIHIDDSKTKAGIRQVPLSDKAKKLLPLPKFNSYVTLERHFCKWKKNHGFDRTLHCTRYTTISLLVSAGVDDRIIKAIVGHKGKDVTSKVYTKVSNEDKRNALNLI